METISKRMRNKGEEGKYKEGVEKNKRVRNQGEDGNKQKRRKVENKEMEVRIEEKLPLGGQ